jgi:cell wall assembly regulator SMI1
MSDVERVWLGLLEELAERAPATRAALRAPVAPDAAVARDAAADALGLELSPELAEWFGLHDGADPFFHGQLLPFNSVLGLRAAVDGVLGTRQIWWSGDDDHLAWDDEPAGTVANTWLTRYVYLGQDGMGGGVFADLRPGPLHGCIRFWDKTDADDQPHIADSLTGLLAGVHRAIATGGGDVGGWTPSIVDGVVEWSPRAL